MERGHATRLFGHGVLKCRCGQVIAQCKCIEGHRNVVVSDEPCRECKRREAMSLNPLEPTAPRPNSPSL